MVKLHSSDAIRRRNDIRLDELDVVLTMCRNNQWSSVLHSILAKPWICVAQINAGSRIATTVLHQAISSREGDEDDRAKVIEAILRMKPEAAAMKNGGGSFPLFSITQRNTKMDAQKKLRLIRLLIEAHKGALVERAGDFNRTPLHNVLLGFHSFDLLEMMVENGPEACFVKEANRRYLPAHVACSRHCSPRKLALLLAANPAALTDIAKDGSTLLKLAISTATCGKENRSLIKYIRTCIEENEKDDEVAPCEETRDDDERPRLLEVPSDDEMPPLPEVPGLLYNDDVRTCIEDDENIGEVAHYEETRDDVEVPPLPEVPGVLYNDDIRTRLQQVRTINEVAPYEGTRDDVEMPPLPEGPSDDEMPPLPEVPGLLDNCDEMVPISDETTRPDFDKKRKLLDIEGRVVECYHMWGEGEPSVLNIADVPRKRARIVPRFTFPVKKCWPFRVENSKGLRTTL